MIARQTAGNRTPPPSLQPVMEVYASPGASLGIVRLSLSEYSASTKVSESGGLAEEGEDIELIEVDVDIAMRWIEEKVICDAAPFLQCSSRCFITTFIVKLRARSGRISTMPQTVKVWLTEPVAAKTCTRLTAFFLALSCFASIAFLGVRNIYDDEYSNFRYVSLPVPQIIRTANSTDVHPPGMYLLTWCAYHLIPSARWMDLLPLLFLYAGLTVFCLSVAPLLDTKASLICFVLIATLHPQLLMWGNTIRWYSWWTGIALITIVIALKSDISNGFSYARATVLSLALVTLFYLNYVTLIFFATLAIAMLLRYGPGIWKQLALITFLFAIGILPQLHILLKVHLPNSSKQSAGAVLSSARLLQATLSSEAYLPWHPLAIGSLLLFCLLIVTGFVWCFKNIRSLRFTTASSKTQSLASIILFSLLFFAFIAATGLGIKPRNGLILAPLLALPLALTVASMRWRMQSAFLIFIVLWAGFGIEHLLLREGLAKSNMINRPEEVASYIRDSQGDNCNIVVTYDSLLTLTIANTNLPRTVLLTPEKFPLPTHHSSSNCKVENLYVVRSSLNDITGATQVIAEINTVSSSLPDAETRNFSFDPDARMKRRFVSLIGGSDVPDYRYVVTSSQISPALLSSIEEQLHHFAPADGRSKPE